MSWLRTALSALRDPDKHEEVGVQTLESRPFIAMTSDGLELSHLGRYLVVAVLVTTCGLLFAWSRIEMVEISSELGVARTQLATAEAEQARIDLELAALKDPAHLSRAAANLALTSDVEVVNVSASEAQ